MTTQNYTHMTNQELVDEILSYKTNYSNLNKFIKNKNFGSVTKKCAKEIFDKNVNTFCNPIWIWGVLWYNTSN